MSNIQEAVSRKVHLIMMLCQTLGVPTFIVMPSLAIERGAIGYILGYIIGYLVVGMPILYMEYIVSQFTSRDCIGVWKIRRCLSHIGYFYVVWQIIIIVYNHTMISFVLHYFLISFEDPIPYYKCGPWSTKDCNLLKHNYTVNQDCIKMNKQAETSYCDYLIQTFPEYQYWRYFILGEKSQHYSIAWQVCLASGCACTVIYFSCFKRQKSVKCFLTVLSVYPLIGYFTLMIGSMMQKGIVLLYEEALDAKFDTLSKRFRLSEIILQVLYSLNLGTGMSFNLSAFSGFRAPCYSNMIITVAICSAFTVFATCTIAMMPCPYAYEYSTTPTAVIKLPLSMMFETVPRMLFEYTNPQLWLVVVYSSNAMLALSTNIIVALCSLEMLGARYKIFNSYPGLTSFVGTVFIFVFSTPLLGTSGVFMVFNFSRSFHLLTLFLVVLECIVFIVWYGVENFCEDVHFMEGIRPKNYMKVAWLLSTVTVTYVYIKETINLFYDRNWTFGDRLGWGMLFSCKSFIVLVTILKLLIAAIRKNFDDCFKLDPKWGPTSDLLLRSRAMFSAQAMTKEYMYRQYHLQAGILARQRTSNVRVCQRENRQ